MRVWLALAAGVLAAGPCAGPCAGQVSGPGGPDAAAYGEAAGYPVAAGRADVNQQAVMVGSYSHYDAVYPSNTVAAAPSPAPLRRAAAALEVSYAFGGGQHTIADYLARNPATGLLIARGDTILFEQYQYGRTERDRLLSQSMAKTVVAMLVGIAVADGAIRSVEDPVEAYLPALAGTELGRTPLRALLHMASGLAFNEVYDGTGDNAALGRALLGRPTLGQVGGDPVAAVARFSERVAPADTVFHYAGVDTEVLGLVVARATGRTLAALLQERVWGPMGAEAAASWAVDGTGQEVAYCCLSATLRDWARFGLMLAHGGAAGGAAGGRQVVPRAWVEAATTAAPFQTSEDGRRWGYGYQTWLMPGGRGSFAMMGIHGQRLFVDPASKLVLVHMAVRVPPTHQPGDSELVALWRAVLRREGG